jgi:hypothetical protein
MNRQRTPREQANHNLAAFFVVMFMLVTALVYMWAIDQYWPGLHQAGVGFRFFVSIPGWLLFAGAIYINFKEIK